MKSKVTVLTTVFNGEKYIKETVDSVLNQSLNEIEYIIVDDGSNDKTGNLLGKIKDDRVKVITIPHSGRGVALNVGVENCETTYLAILDADDLAYKDRLLLQLNIFGKNSDVDVVSSRCTVNISNYYNNNTYYDDSLSVSTINHKKFIKHNAICHSSAMIKVQSLREIGGYDAKRSELFDYDLWVRLIERGSIFMKIEAPLVYKRIHTDQYFEKNKRIKYLYSSTKCKYRVINLMPAGVAYYIFPVASFCYGLLPRKVRKYFMDIIGGF